MKENFPQTSIVKNEEEFKLDKVLNALKEKRFKKEVSAIEEWCREGPLE